MTYQAITLVSGGTTVTLPADMRWTDRRGRDLVATSVTIQASGAPVIEEFQQIGGYPITLVAGGAGDTWVDEASIDQLVALADSPLTTPMTLTYNDGTVVLVRFRRGTDGIAVDAQQIHATFPSDSSVPLSQAYSLTLRLMQASE
jgi:hypothetical protein